MRRALGLALAPALALLAVELVGAADPLVVTRHRFFRQGPLLLFDALVENRSPQTVAQVEVTAEFLSFFDELLRLEHVGLQPPVLGPAHRGALRVATPWHEAIRKVRLRFTWWIEGQQFQSRPEDELLIWR